MNNPTEPQADTNNKARKLVHAELSLNKLQHVIHGSYFKAS